MAESNKALITEACKRLDVKVSSLLASVVNRERGTVSVILEDHRKIIFTIEELEAKPAAPKVDNPKPTAAKVDEPKPDKA